MKDTVRVCFATSFVFFAVVCAAASCVEAVSPDGRNRICLRTDILAISVERDGIEVVGCSQIDINIEGRSMAQNASVVSVVDRSVQGTMETPVYKKRAVDLTRTEKYVDFGEWGVAIAARNDGVAYRFETRLSGCVTVTDESVSLKLPQEASSVAYVTDTFGREECRPHLVTVNDIKTDGSNAVYLPLTYSTKGKSVSITESDLMDYPCLYLKRICDRFESAFARWPKKTFRAQGWDKTKSSEKRGRWEVVEGEERFLVKTQGCRSYPWRVFVLSDTPSSLCESDAVYALARPAADRDWSWVRPGKVAWDWWNAFDNIGDPKGCTTKTYERFIDFASKNDIEYVILDEGWSADLNIWELSPNVDLRHLIAYAKARNVGIILWMAWGQTVGDESRVAWEFAKMGVKGFKVDFMDRADAQCERFIWKFAEECAKNRLVIDYHGANRPTGLSRTYPNVLNYEGVLGLENMKWYRGDFDMMANDVAAFFGRMTAGPMDYTPGAMDNYPIGRYPKFRLEPVGKDPLYHNPGSVGTRCHQMAMIAMYEAPLQMLADAPTKYEKNMECFRFMAAIPTVWDKTVGLGGNFDTYAACARLAKDGSWYVSVLNNATAREVKLETKFLQEGKWRMEVFCDADVNSIQYAHETHVVKAGDRIHVRLASGGGYAACLRQLNGDSPRRR